MKNKFLFVPFAAICAVLFASCAKDMGALDASYFKTNPSPLEVKGGMVDATVTGQFPVKYFNKNAVVTVTPVLKYAGGEVKGTAKSFQGEKVKGNDKQIAYKAGGNYTMPVSFKYVPAMAKSELYLEFAVQQQKKTYTIPSVKVADGVIATSLLAAVNASEIAPAIIPDAFQKVIQQTQEADFLFLIGQSDLRKNELQKQSVANLMNKIKEVQKTENQSINKLAVSGYASPDGPLALNSNLAEKRENVTLNYLNGEFKKMKTSAPIDAKFTAEDWDGFQKLMEKSNIQDKELILRVLSMYTDPEQREREIKNIASAFKTIADEILPQLRRSRMNLVIDITGKSDEQIMQLATEKPSSLSVEELLYAASLAGGDNVKELLYKSATEVYPNEPRAWNNLGASQFALGKVDAAKESLLKAVKLDSKLPDVNYNLGLVSLAQGNVADAQQYLGKAAGTNGNLNKALGTLYVIEGDYAKAKTSFGSTVSNNAALTQILNKDYAAARTTLAAVAHPDATTSYLAAVVAARTNDRAAVYSNLKQSYAQDSAVAKKALNDIEFAKFFTESEFQSILK